MPSYKLSYFNVRGLGECSRILFHVADVAFEDHRYDFSITDGKYNLGHKDDQAAGVLDLSNGSVPLLYVDGKAAIAQSRAIERYLAKQFNLAGKSDVEAAQVDMWTEHVRDVQDKYQKAKASKDAECEDPVAKWFKDDLPGLLAKLDKVAALTSTTPGCAVGDDLTLADIKIWMMVCDYFDAKDVVLAAVKEHAPRLAAIVEKVANHEGLKAWLATRPVTPF